MTMLAVAFLPGHYPYTLAQEAHGPVASDVAPRQSGKRVVRVGVYQNWPKVFVGDDGLSGGFFVDFLADVASAEGWELEPVNCDWADCLDSLTDGRIDIMPDVAWSAERSRRFDFHTTPVIESWSQLYSRPARDIENLDDLRGQRIAILDGSIQLDSLRQLVTGLGIPVEFVLTSSLDDAFLAVKSGRADVATANHFFGDYFYRSYGLKKTGVVFQPASVYFATGKGKNADLLAVVEKHIRSQRADSSSRYYEYLRKWMARSEIPVEVPVWLYWLAAVLVGMLLLSVGIMYLLRSQVRLKTAHLARANMELKEIQAELLKNQQILGITQEMASVGGWEWDAEAGRMTWTEETYRIHGLSRGDTSPGSPDLIKRSLDMYDPANSEKIRVAFDKCCADGTPYVQEAEFIDAYGAKKHVRTAARAIVGADGRIVKVVGTLMDITQIKAEQDARIRAEEELRVSRRMETVGHLAGGIAHDFNNLLSAILGYTGLILRRSDLPDQLKNDLTQIQKAGERAANLTHQLLAFGSKRTLQPRVVSLNSVVTGLEKLLGRVLSENIRVETRLAPDAGNVRIDPGQMEQVIINLAVNSRDAMPDGGTLVIETSSIVIGEKTIISGVSVSPGRWAVLSVTDTGTGIDEPTLKRIFEPFFTTKEVGRGTGLGLATVFKIVSRGGGRVIVDSTPGEGSAFKVFLPALDAPALEPAPAITELVSGSGTILVAEDDDEVRIVAERILSAAGYRVLTAVDGAEAVAMCQRHSQEIDLVLADMVLPRLDGHGVAETLRMRCPGIRVVFMSGHADLGSETMGALDLGSNFVRKPFTAYELTARIHEVLSRPA